MQLRSATKLRSVDSETDGVVDSETDGVVDSETDGVTATERQGTVQGSGAAERPVRSVAVGQHQIPGARGGATVARGAAARSEARWFVAHGGERLGPYTAADMAGWLEGDERTWDSQVWREGMSGWRPARRDPLLAKLVARRMGSEHDTVQLDDVSQRRLKFIMSTSHPETFDTEPLFPTGAPPAPQEVPAGDEDNASLTPSAERLSAPGGEKTSSGLDLLHSGAMNVAGNGSGEGLEAPGWRPLVLVAAGALGLGLLLALVGGLVDSTSIDGTESVDRSGDAAIELRGVDVGKRVEPAVPAAAPAP